MGASLSQQTSRGNSPSRQTGLVTDDAALHTAQLFLDAPTTELRVSRDSERRREGEIHDQRLATSAATQVATGGTVGIGTLNAISDKGITAPDQEEATGILNAVLIAARDRSHPIRSVVEGIHCEILRAKLRALRTEEPISSQEARSKTFGAGTHEGPMQEFQDTAMESARRALIETMHGKDWSMDLARPSVPARPRYILATPRTLI